MAQQNRELGDSLKKKEEIAKKEKEAEIAEKRRLKKLKEDG